MPDELQHVLGWLQRQGTPAQRNGLARFAITTDKAFGVPVGVLRQQAKRLGQNHELAAGLWDSGWYEARMLACFIDEPARVTPRANGPLVPRLRQLGDLRYRVLRAVRQNTSRLEQNSPLVAPPG
jgi:3-methyladenine DNA glycosylase AlkD